MELSLTLEELYKGKTLVASLASEQPCATCHGKGYTLGPSGAQWPCDTCKSKGKIVTKTTARIIIPRGAPEGGTASVPTKTGLVRVRFTSRPHAVFKRAGMANLALSVAVTEDEAAGGFTRSIQLLSGEKLLLTRLGPSAAIDFLPIPGLGLPNGPQDADGFGELGITFTLDGTVRDSPVRESFAAQSATLPRLLHPPRRFQLLGSLEPERTTAVAGLIAAIRIRDEDTAAKGARVMDGSHCFAKDATIYTWEALLAPRAGVSGGLVSANQPQDPPAYSLMGAKDSNPEFNSYGARRACLLRLTKDMLSLFG